MLHRKFFKKVHIQFPRQYWSRKHLLHLNFLQNVAKLDFLSDSKRLWSHINLTERLSCLMAMVLRQI